MICAYLDEAYPGRAAARGAGGSCTRRWFENMPTPAWATWFIWGLVHQKVVHPIIWGEPGDQARIERTLGEDLPRELDYLEGELPAEGWLFDGFGLADIALATFFRNGAYAGFEVDAGQWPRTAAFVTRALAHDAFASLLPFEDTQRQTTPQRRREALVEIGAPLSEETLATREARRGIMAL